MLRRTPLFEAHQELGARLIDFGGWEMPVQYTGIVDEHLAVRQAAGLFDISHMGEVEIEGQGATRYLNRVLTNDLNKLLIGNGQYTLMCNERGGVIDDLYAYRLGDERFILIINASRIEVDLEWLRSQALSDPATGTFSVTDRSDELGAVAVQGPRVQEFIEEWLASQSPSVTGADRLTDLKKNQVGAMGFAGSRSFVARTGYTGEDGFEIVAPGSRLPAIWKALLEKGRSFGLQPAGLGARDTLRTEMGYPLYGHELDEKTTPIEAGLSRFVAFDKGEFVGAVPLKLQKEKGPARKCVAFKMEGRSAPPRPDYLIYPRGGSQEAIGRVASGTQSPSLGAGIGMGYVPPETATPGSMIDIQIRAGRFPATVVPKPIFRKEV